MASLLQAGASQHRRVTRSPPAVTATRSCSSSTAGRQGHLEATADHCPEPGVHDGCPSTERLLQLHFHFQTYRIFYSTNRTREELLPHPPGLQDAAFWVWPNKLTLTLNDLPSTFRPVSHLCFHCNKGTLKPASFMFTKHREASKSLKFSGIAIGE